MIDLSEKGQQYIRQGFEEFAVAYDLHFYHFVENIYVFHYMKYIVMLDVVLENYTINNKNSNFIEMGKGMDKLFDRISFEF